MVPEAPVETIPPSVASAPGIDREEHALRAQGLVELLARDAGLDGDVEVVDRQAQDRVHLAHVDADPALQRLDVALERGARAEGHERRAVAGAHPDDGRGLLGARRVDDRVGRGRRMKRLVDAVLIEHVAPGEHPLGAQQRAQVVEQLLDGGLGEASALL